MAAYFSVYLLLILNGLADVYLAEHTIIDSDRENRKRETSEDLNVGLKTVGPVTVLCYPQVRTSYSPYGCEEVIKVTIESKHF